MRGILVLLTLLCSVQVLGQPYPFNNEEHSRFNTIENMSGDITFAKSSCANTWNCTGTSTVGAGVVEQTMIQAATVDGLNLKRVARANHNFAVDGGTASGVYPSGVTIPASAIITSSYLKINSTIVSLAEATFSLTCDASADLFAATDLSEQATTILRGLANMIPDDGTAIFTDGCNVAVDVGAGGSGITAGNLTWFLEYDITD